MVALVVVLALAAAGYAGSVVGPHFKSSSAVASTTTTTTHPVSTTTSTVPHASVNVLVANGTSEANAAGHFSAQLQQQGWSVATPQNATSSASTTNVYYAPGQQQAAAEVASAIGVASSAVQPLSASVPVTSTSGLDVVVVIGPDLAGNGFPPPSTTTT